MKKTILILIIAVAVLGGGFWFYNSYKVATPTNLEYKNEQYGFTFSLPASWNGYSIITDKWEGYDLTQQSPQGQVITERGPMISIRHPLWTTQNPRQDIPIMIFTINQWNDLQGDKFHIGAAPINPSELGRNNTYVFALPARYNFAYPEGFQEVEQILNGNPLHIFNIVSTPTPVNTNNSGIKGKVTIGPTCPVQRIPPDPNCADKLFQADFNILNSSGQVVKSFSSDANGTFSVELPSGNYEIVNTSPRATPPTFRQQGFTVLPGEYLDLNLQFDSGIR